MCCRKKSALLFAAVALAAVFFLAVPAEAAESRGGPPGVFDRLIAWAMDGWERWMPAVSMSGTKSDDREGGYLDPNGGGGRTGSCGDPAACENPLPATTGSGIGS